MIFTRVLTFLGEVSAAARSMMLTFTCHQPPSYAMEPKPLPTHGACRYYNDIVSTHPSVALSENGDDEDVDELTMGMIEAAQVRCACMYEMKVVSIDATLPS